MALIWLWCAWAASGDVRVALTADASINWTTLQLDIQAKGDPKIMQGSQKISEQVAIDAVDVQVPRMLDVIPVRDGVLSQDLHEVPAYGGLWSITQSRYYPNRNVSVTGSVSLHQFFEAWMLARAADPPLVTLPTGPSGVVLDARGLGAIPCYAPKLMGEDGLVRYDSILWRDVIRSSDPAVWVSDPASTRTALVAGYDPVLMRASSADGCTLTLGVREMERWDREIADTEASGSGHLVIVVDR